MVGRTFMRAMLVTCLVACCARTSAAQSLGTFRFQLQPFCNVVSLSILQVGPVFALDGFDDQCGVESRSSVVGTAFFNPDGSVGIGLTLISVPGGRPIHIGVALSTATLQGPWWDSAGNLGTFVLTPGSGTGGTPRPFVGGIGAAAIDPTQVQRRVSGTCAPGSVVRAINEDGSVVCETAVKAGTGLTAVATSSGMSLSVKFAGSGGATTVAHSDHTHARGANTAVGALAFNSNTMGAGNTAVGSSALGGNTTGSNNTAVGAFSLDSNIAGFSNTAVGASALGTNAEGSINTAMGSHALSGNTLGNANVALGVQALASNTTGSHNIAIGYVAGGGLTSGQGNIYLGASAADPDESGIIRIGSSNQHSAAFIKGIYGNVVSGSDVFINADGKLGTQASSARFKEDIRPLGDISATLHRLQPVSFAYRPEHNAGASRQYGLIAEQVARVMPELVIRDAEGLPFSVRYHMLPTLLLAEVQRLERERTTLADRLDAQTREVDALRVELWRMLDEIRQERAGLLASRDKELK